MANAWPYQGTRIATGLRFMLGIAMFPRRASTGNGTVCIDNLIYGRHDFPRLFVELLYFLYPLSIIYITVLIID